MPTFYTREERDKIQVQEEKEGYCPFCDSKQEKYHLKNFKNPYRHLSYNKFPYGWIHNREKVVMAIPHKHREHTSELSLEERQAFHDVEVFMKKYFWEKTYFMFIREHMWHKSVKHIHFHFVAWKIHASQVATMIS